MRLSIETHELTISGMHCTACVKRLTNAISKLDGLISVQVSYPDNLVRVTYQSELCNLETIRMAIIQAGYEPAEPASAKSQGALSMVLVFGIVLALGQFASGIDMTARLQGNVTYLLLFTIGVFTSLHCIGMCGGILLSQSIRSTDTTLTAVAPALSYNAGRLISYTLLGGLVGALGSVLSLSLQVMAIVTIVAGLFMILMGVNVAGFDFARRLLRLPFFSGKFAKPKTPFLIGLLNGLLPCGPLQTMQLYALSTGSASAGALSMFIFALGTMPLMLSFGSISALLSKHATTRLLKFSGLFIIALGLIMTNRGLSLAGVGLPFTQYTSQNIAAAAIKAEISDGVQTLKITADQDGYTPNVLFVQKGIPLKLIIDGQQITSCNNELIIPSLNLKKKLHSGENVLEFTPQNDELKFSCWMGMLNGIIKTVDDLASVDMTKVAVAAPANNRCCGGSSGCGMSSAATTSIYGDDINKVPTAKLIHKAVLTGSIQNATVKGSGFELEPLLLVLQQQAKTNLILDLAQFDDPSGEWVLYDYEKKAVIKSFTALNKGRNELELPPQPPTSLGLYKDKKIMAVIEFVENLAASDPETIRQKYLR